MSSATFSDSTEYGQNRSTVRAAQRRLDQLRPDSGQYVRRLLGYLWEDPAQPLHEHRLDAVQVAVLALLVDAGMVARYKDRSGRYCYGLTADTLSRD